MTELRKDLIARLIPLADAHAAADEYRHGSYDWIDVRGLRPGACSIGCTHRDAVQLGILPADPGRGGGHSRRHRALSDALGVPVDLLVDLDQLFEALGPEDDRRLTPAFLRALLEVAEPERLSKIEPLSIDDREESEPAVADSDLVDAFLNQIRAC